MSDRGPERLGAAVGVLVLCAAVALVLGGRRGAAAAERSAAFQRIVGGLGSGSALDLRDCEPSFDGGLDDGCSRGLGPVPGAFPFCPHCAGPSLRR